MKQPLSPHLSIYKPHLTMVMSILHRITGAGLYFGSVFFIIWLFCIATGAARYNFFMGLFENIIVQIILFCFVWSLLHHMLGGAKHLVQDSGAWLGKQQVNFLAILQPIISLLGAASLFLLACL